MSQPSPTGQSPLLSLAAGLAAAGEDFILLYSGVQTAYSGGQSLLFWDPAERLSTSDAGAIAEALRREPGVWAGYLGYDLRHAVEPHLPHDRRDREISPGSDLPDAQLIRPKGMVRFDHQTGGMEITHRDGRSLPLPCTPPQALPPVTALNSPMSREAYLQGVRQIVAEIHRGELYQANLTRKFTGRFATMPDPFALFCRLAEASPGTYSAYLKLGDLAVISSSPERFLTLTPDRWLQSRPIKGTAPRHADPEADRASRKALQASLKDQAENLMIVDLMRNDFARSCRAGSVTVEGLFEVSSYRTVHHMASTVRGQLQEGVTAWEALLGCFPPGSMTGAPKIRAMELCSRLEQYRRGIYSGAIGWFDAGGGMDWSVVIRTLVLWGEQFEFQVGGGIVADSTPEAEWRETLTKARGIMLALGLDPALLESL